MVNIISKYTEIVEQHIKDGRQTILSVELSNGRKTKVKVLEVGDDYISVTEEDGAVYDINTVNIASIRDVTLSETHYWRGK